MSVSCSSIPHSVLRHVLTNVNSPSSLFGKLARLCMCVCVVCVCVCVYVWVGWWEMNNKVFRQLDHSWGLPESYRPCGF